MARDPLTGMLHVHPVVMSMTDGKSVLIIIRAQAHNLQ